MKIDKKKAYELSYKLWYWLFQNPGKRKSDSPYWEGIKEMENCCPLCEYNAHKKIGCECEGCPGNNTPFKCFDGAFAKWVCSGSSSKPYAAHIAFTIRKALKRLNNESK